MILALSLCFYITKKSHTEYYYIIFINHCLPDSYKNANIICLDCLFLYNIMREYKK